MNRIKRIAVYQVDLPLKEGSYNWSEGKSVSVFDSTVVAVETEDGLIMAIQHKKYNIHGVQFHPESIKTVMGLKILKNFINYKIS